MINIKMITWALLVVGCGFDFSSRKNDIGTSPKDLNKPFYVVYLGEYSVYLGECPPYSPVLNRNCKSFKMTQSLKLADYQERLDRLILMQRPDIGEPVPSKNPEDLKGIEEKIKRLEQKLASDKLSDEERKDLEAQLAALKKELGGSQIKLTQEEEQRRNFLMSKLKEGNDITFDEGEVNYRLSIGPFMKNFLDITTSDGVKPSTCKDSPLNCTIMDLLTGRSWTKTQVQENWSVALDRCANVLNQTTTIGNIKPGYNGTTGWRLPTREDMLFASKHFVPYVREKYWITSNELGWRFLSSTRCPENNQIWYTHLYFGSDSWTNCQPNQEESQFVCVRP